MTAVWGLFMVTQETWVKYAGSNFRQPINTFSFTITGQILEYINKHFSQICILIDVKSLPGF